MAITDVAPALGRLRTAADTVLNGFPMVRWTRVSGPGADVVEQHGNGGMPGLQIISGQDVVLRTDLEVPAEALGVTLTGDTLEGVLFSLYPADITLAGEPIFSDHMAPVASGPALFVVTPELKAGANGPMELHIRIPGFQTTPWFQFRLTTPGLRARFEALDLCGAQIALAQALCASPGDEFALAAAASAVPSTIPEAGADVAAMCAAVEAALAPFAQRAKSIPVHLVGHSHIDMNWMWTMPDTIEVIKRDFRSVLNLMDEFPELTFSHSQPATYEVIREQEPALFEKVLQHIVAGRWEPMTLQWVEGDVNMASGEGQVRQILEAVGYSRDVLCYHPRAFHCPDTFGHAGNLPQLAVQGGAVSYYHHRANPGGYTQWPAYWWEGDDGTRVLAISTGSYNGEIYPRDVADAAIRAIRSGLPEGLHFHGIGDHGGGPSRQNLQALRRFGPNRLMPNAYCSTVAAYTDGILRSNAALPTHKGETSTIFEGCYTTHADTKFYNRSGENLLTSADTAAAMAGIDRVEPLSQAWRKVLFNQFHDIFDGSAIHEVYELNREEYEEARDVAASVTNDAQDLVEMAVYPGCIAVTNPLGFARKEWVTVPGLSAEGCATLTDGQGRSAVGQYTAEGLGFVAEVGAFATAGYHVTNTAAGAPGLTVTATYGPSNPHQVAPDQAEAGMLYWRVETPVFTALVRRDCGVIVSLTDKRMGRELVSFGVRRPSDYMDTARPDLALNVLQFVDEWPHPMTSWQIQEVYSQFSLIRGAETQVLETGPARVVIGVKQSHRETKIEQKIVFYRDLDRIDFEADVDWQEVGNAEKGIPNLKVAFTASMPECEPWFETPFGAVTRPSDGQEVPALRWADIGGSNYGVAVLNDSKYAYDAMGCRLRLTLVRTGYDPDYASDLGKQCVRYALLPHVGSWQSAGVVQAGLSYNQPLLARLKSGCAPLGDDTSFRPVLSGSPGVVAASMKRAQKGSGVVIRLYESTGSAGLVRLSGLAAGVTVTVVTVTEDVVGPATVVDGSVELALRPWQVVSLMVRG